MASTQAGEITSSTRDHNVSVEDDSLKKAVKDIAFGSFAGMVAELFEYPFDLAKVRLQAQLLVPTSSSNVTTFNGPMDCLMQTWREEGVRGLYRGLPAPIVGSMAETATLFVTYTAFQDAIRALSPSTSSDQLTIPQLALAAGGAGFVASFVLTPIELVKCKMQVQMMNFHPTPTAGAPGRIPHRPNPTFSSLAPHFHAAAKSTSHHTTTTSPKSKSSSSSSSSSSPHRSIHHDAVHRSASTSASASRAAAAAIETLRPPGPITLIRSIIDTYGVRGLWLGHTGTLLRETGGTAAWFVAKEYVARQLIERRIRQSPYMPSPTGDGTSIPRTIANTELLVWESALSGALAGAIGALLFYPADTVKSAIQTEEELKPRNLSTQAWRARKPSTFLGVLRQMVKTHGVKGLYAGCGMTVARAVPSSGIIFVVYDGLTAYFG
ncbi:hypothetical protein D9613_008445 [Agrocybe pediades]|uniref:Mitochondrial carrier n=1 Tax=Agrocybe pediades TaxID=84607 RepID=A0A8H4VNC2_9AGAR|nr:hypothetical protein D9613_008445 [Agrocybe pediades]